MRSRSMKTKHIKKERTLRYTHNLLLGEFSVTEREFGELLTDKWELVKEDPQLQKKALAGAKKLKELKLMLITHKLLPLTIQ